MNTSDNQIDALRSNQMKSISITIFLGLFCMMSNALSQSIKEYIVPKINTSIKAPEFMIPMSDSHIEAQNNDMLRLRPQSFTRYVYGFSNSKDKSTDGTDEHIYIQITPMSVPPITPEKFVQMLPKTFKSKKEEFTNLLSNSVKSLDNMSGQYSKELEAVIVDSTVTLPNQKVCLLRSYIVFTKKYIISINSYAPPEDANSFFDISNQIVNSLKINKEDKMPDTWINKLQQLISI